MNLVVNFTNLGYLIVGWFAGTSSVAKALLLLPRAILAEFDKYDNCIEALK